jgi:hypothetical protein
MASQTAVSHQLGSITDYKSISGVKSTRVSIPTLSLLIPLLVKQVT